MSHLEFRLASLLLRLVGLACSVLPISRRKVVLATARIPRLEGNLAALHAAMLARHPDRHYVLLLEPYSYGFLGKLAYLARLVRGMYHLQTASLFIVDNAYLPVHLGPHRAGTTVVQVWHAVGALKRFGAGALTPLRGPEATFLHRYYDAVVVPSEAARAPYAAALRTPIERVLALGAPRTDALVDGAAIAATRARLDAAHPVLAGRTVVLFAPTFRGRGRGKHASTGLDAVALRAALPADHVLVLKTHPNLSPHATPGHGFDLIVDPHDEMNDWLMRTDILITDYSSSINEYALLRRPLILLVPDLDAYARDPGLYLDYRTEMIGTQVIDTDGVIGAIRDRRYDVTTYDAYIARHVGWTDGGSSQRFVTYFLEGGRPEAR